MAEWRTIDGIYKRPDMEMFDYNGTYTFSPDDTNLLVALKFGKMYVIDFIEYQKRRRVLQKARETAPLQTMKPSNK